MYFQGLAQSLPFVCTLVYAMLWHKHTPETQIASKQKVKSVPPSAELPVLRIEPRFLCVVCCHSQCSLLISPSFL